MIYAGKYHIKGNVASLGIEGLEPYRGNINHDVWLEEDFDNSGDPKQKVLVQFDDFKGNRKSAYVLVDKLVYIPHEPAPTLSHAEHIQIARDRFQKDYKEKYGKSSLSY